MAQGIVIHFFPVLPDQCGYEQQQSTLGLVEIGYEPVHYAETVSGDYDYAGAAGDPVRASRASLRGILPSSEV